jgi:ubiquinone/menaquinone biosynthesis C-methylase UbiE
MQQKLGRFYLKHFLKILAGQQKSGRFLEIGCGPGYQTARVADNHPESRIQALEPSAEMIAIAKSYLKQQGLANRVGFTQGTAEDEKTVGSLGQFDLIYSTFSLHHWKDPVRAIRNLHDALGDEGVLLIHDFERHWLTYYFPVRRRGLAESLRASFTAHEIATIADQAGLNRECYHIQRHFPYLSVIAHKG